MSDLVVVDLGTGNLHSVGKALERVAPGQSIKVTRAPQDIAAAQRVVLPGQGAIGSWLRALANDNLEQVLKEAITSKPVLGICLGLQSLYEACDEDVGTVCLGVLSGRVRRFSEPAASGARLKVPHMGWNRVNQVMDHPMWSDIGNGARFYFVHSYYAPLPNGGARNVAGVTEYGIKFVSAAARDNVFAVQFHPEKSHQQGLTLLRNFVRWDGTA